MILNIGSRASRRTQPKGGNRAGSAPFADNASLVKRLPILFGLAAVLLVATAAGASSTPRTTGASATAFAIRVTAPGQTGGTVASVTAPPDRSSSLGGWAYPADGSVVSSGSASASAASASGSSTANASASSDVTSLSLFGGEITASSVAARANARASRTGATGDVSGSGVSGLVALGQPVSGGRIALGDWGYANVGTQVVTPFAPGGGHGQKTFVIGLEVHLTAAHGGLPAGSVIQVGYAQAQAQASAPPPPPRRPKKTPPTTTPPREPDGGRTERAPGRSRRAGQGDSPGKKEDGRSTPPVRSAPQDVTPPLTPGGYVFPVYGPSSYSDTWGAPRAHVGWHHGTDIFAPLGAPVLAVADGTVFSVGWNDVGGNRLWLRDRGGNEFYYAHLSAFSEYAKNGARVKAGTVVGFVGNTGDAEGTPYHLHFEIHPVSLLALGYDGAVNPTSYLDAWKRLRDIRFAAARAAWVPHGAGLALSTASGSSAPQPGAMLLEVSDISEASGLEPDSLRRAFVPPPSSERGTELDAGTPNVSEERSGTAGRP